MVDANERLDTTYAMREYQNPKFDGKLVGLKISPAKHTDWNRQKGGNFIDWYIKRKAHVPPPNLYTEVAAKVTDKKMPSYSLYKSERKTGFAEIIASAEKKSMVGPGTFNPKQAQEKIIGIYGDKGDRVTLAASVMMDANNVPPMNKY